MTMDRNERGDAADGGGQYFPTEGWLEAYGRLLDESEAFSEFGEGWGDGFDGDVCYVVEDLPLAETRLGDLPVGVLSDLPEHVRERVAEVPLAEAPETFAPIREGLPASVEEKLDQLETYVHDDAVYARIGLEDGACTGVEVLDDPDAADVGFVLRGEYGTWRSVVDGRPSTAAVLTGELAFEGSTVRRVQYAPMFQLLGELAAEVETVHLFEGRASSTPVLDTAVRGHARVQRQTRRHLKRTFDLF
ncbi:sterol carrier protein [Natronomonas salina]|uniref:sterol carrier protein n=1 Tax=Natronomonas salina TaxID=1710540 RepID=UPI0015B45051|nr:sterol carrier protein [Natronomonas salina]QLD87570.1 sterol carrier protein [Natronomonas salina]